MTARVIPFTPRNNFTHQSWPQMKLVVRRCTDQPNRADGRFELWVTLYGETEIHVYRPRPNRTYSNAEITRMFERVSAAMVAAAELDDLN